MYITFNVLPITHVLVISVSPAEASRAESSEKAKGV